MTKDEYNDHISTRKTVEKLINSKLHAESVSRSFELSGENGCRYRLFLRQNHVLFESFSVGINGMEKHFPHLGQGELHFE